MHLTVVSSSRPPTNANVIFIWSRVLQSEWLNKCWHAILNTVIPVSVAVPQHYPHKFPHNTLECRLQCRGEGASVTWLRTSEQLCWGQEWHPLSPCHLSRLTASLCLHCELFHSSRLQKDFLHLDASGCVSYILIAHSFSLKNSLIFCSSANRQELIKSAPLSFSVLKGTKLWYLKKSKKTRIGKNKNYKNVLTEPHLAVSYLLILLFSTPVTIIPTWHCRFPIDD